MVNSNLEQNIAPEKPCLVDTGRGFSVSYKNRFLYSKYAPEKNIISYISSLQILPGTLFVISSPVLWYGLKELLEKLPENCYIIALEKDEELYNFSVSNNPIASQEFYKNKVKFLAPSECDLIVNILLKKDIPEKLEIPEIYLFRRVIYIEFSGGSSLFKDEYNNLASLAQGAVSSFWKNRITLTKLGRLYSRNIFKNLALLPESVKFTSLKNSISDPIFVFGAGESTVEVLKAISPALLKQSFIICVDAVLPILKAFHIVPDAVAAVEGQLAIEKAYIGNTKVNSIFFADLASRKSVLNHCNKSICYFLSDYADTKFLTKLTSMKFSPEKIPAMGSVGLTATYIAEKLRRDASVPIFIAGLDFSFSEGKTHGQNAPAHLARLIKNTRFNGIENFHAAYKEGSIKTSELKERKYFTDIALSNYAKHFKAAFENTPSLFNMSSFGLNLGIPFVTALQTSDFLNNNTGNKKLDLPLDSIRNTEEIIDFLSTEEKALNRIKELLINGKDVECCGIKIEDELNELISKREYLFLHFPDGYKCSVSDLSFLKRIRSELDFFLKDIKKSIAELMQ